MDLVVRTLTVALARPVASGWRSASGWSLPMIGCASKLSISTGGV